MLVADHIEQPDEAPGPAAAFVVVDDVGGIGAMAQFTEEFFQLGFRRRQARCWWLAELRALGIDETSPWNMAAAVAIDAGQIDQNQLWRVEAGLQVSRFDHQWQAGKVSHPESPVRNRGGDCSAWVRRCGC